MDRAGSTPEAMCLAPEGGRCAPSSCLGFAVFGEWCRDRAPEVAAALDDLHWLAIRHDAGPVTIRAPRAAAFFDGIGVAPVVQRLAG